MPWNRVGLTHLAFNVRDTAKWYDYLVNRGVECLGKPERSPRGHTFFFARDLDGNLIEIPRQPPWASMILSQPQLAGRN